MEETKCHTYYADGPGTQATRSYPKSVCKDLCTGAARTAPLSGWKKWGKFPSDKLIQDALKVGLYLEVWEKKTSPPVIAVVFRGTTSLKDWISNMHWVLRFVPFIKDQYIFVSRKVGEEFVNHLANKLKNESAYSKGVCIVATGHSLGGGLAQHLAYSLPLKSSNGIPVQRVSSVFAFNPSPITGWFTLICNSKLRTINTKRLKIERIFEHGEILAFIRLLLRYVYPPGVREIRYNFVKSKNPFKSHSMRLMACALIKASGQVHPPHLFDDLFRDHK